MRKLALALAVPSLLVIAACGADTKSCGTAPAALNTPSSSCTLAPNADVTLLVRAQCDTCSHTNPSCEAEMVGGELQLNTRFQACSEDVSCQGGCTFGNIPCTFRTPGTGPLTVVYLASTSSNTTGSVTLNVGSGGVNQCNLAALADGSAAP